MSDSKGIVNSPAPVTVAGRVFLASALSQRQELALWNKLRAMARPPAAQGGYMARHRATLDALKAAGMTAEWSALVAHLCRCEAAPLASPEEADAFRETAAGVAEELFWRTREAHPEVTRAEVAALVTEVNAPDVHESILRALEAPADAAGSKSG